MNLYHVYILTNKRNGALYIGVTSNLLERVDQHKRGIYDGFTKKYSINKLVYYETFENINDAIAREKQLKKFNRKWKIELIEKENPTGRDIYGDLF